MIRIRTAALAFVMMSGFSTVALAAGQISDDALNADRKSCNTACTNKGQSGDFCSTYCDCTVKGIGAELSLDEYRGISEAADKKQPAPQPALDKLKKITNSCRTEMGKP
jgi:uncharacterized membrane protein